MTWHCKTCGQYHYNESFKMAEVLLAGKDRLETEWGTKTKCGLAAMLDTLIDDAKGVDP